MEGAWLHTLERELTEEEWIKKAGGIKKVSDFLNEYGGLCTYFSLVLDNPEKPWMIGHSNGNGIHACMTKAGHIKYQTMELKLI